MARKIALLFAGQGAQSVGMGQELAKEFPSADAVFKRGNGILGRDITRIAWDGPMEDLTRTGNCQPALFLHGLAALAVLRERFGDFPVHAAAGLSLGEFTAHAAAGSFDFETGLRLVAKRGEFMDEACAANPGSMAALIGCDEAAARGLASETDVDVANLNCPGQIVISGEAAKISMAMGLAKEHGIKRALPLTVAGAYHSRLMDSAYKKLAGELEKAEIVAPKFPVICNVDARPVTEPARIRETLLEQVTGAVRWQDSMEYLIKEGCDLFLELGTGTVLAGFMGRINREMEVLSVSDPDSVHKAIGVLENAF